MPNYVPSNTWTRQLIALTAAVSCAGGVTVAAASPMESNSADDLTRLSLADLANVEVTSVSKSSQSLQKAAASIFVITHDDIQRSSATNVFEALRLAPNLLVTQVSATSYTVSARGFGVAVDPLRISHSISNLLTNAVKYTDANGNISLNVELLEQEIAISVKDDGIGLEPQSIPRVFDMFSQVKSAIDRSEGGLGIGLALVKGMIQLHGGRVEATSPGIGRGSQFTIRLPRARMMAHTAEGETSMSKTSVRAGGRRTVLVADDNRDAADTLALLLDMDGYETAVAYGGQQALDSIRQKRPDAVILDIGMPDLNGYEVARRIREEEWARNLLLLAITGWGHADDVARAKAAGFNEHLTKPVDADSVVRLLAKYLSD